MVENEIATLQKRVETALNNISSAMVSDVCHLSDTALLRCY
ncbi:hypothetical protein ACJ72_07155 [Emergomyces africanus]|uniref:Uncharacterized protein n=1 Tax=Emergomyces africanus TaxID=1955775 RepID=A0A1B7NPD8_9EURO|nr:hypothetical protein ACJ72_07155 [Emergomyces africanus]